MFNRKIIELLQSLTPAEFKKLYLFLTSPYFNTNSSIIKLYEILKKHYPAFTNKKLEKKFVFSKLYPGNKYQDGTMRNLFSDFRILLLKYLSLLNIEKDQSELKHRLMLEADFRKLDKLFTDTLKLYKKELFDSNNLGYNIFEKIKQLYDLKINFSLKRGDQKSVTNDILLRSEFTVFAFIINMFNDVQNLKINKDAYNATYRHNLAEDVIRNIDPEKILEVSGTSLAEYSELFKLFVYEGLAFVKIEEDSYYFEFKNLFQKFYDKLSMDSRDNLFITLENICIEKVFNGNSYFIKEGLEVYKERLNKGIYKDETNEFNVYLFRNIILSTVSCKDTEWLKEFVNKYSRELPIEFKSEMEEFANCLILFEEGRYGQSIKSASRIIDKAEIFKYSLYSLKLKIYYETGDFDTLEYSIDAFNHFITLNKHVSERFRNSNKNFIKAVNTLLKIKTGRLNPHYIISLKKFILKNKYFKEKKWLLNKISDIEKENNIFIR